MPGTVVVSTLSDGTNSTSATNAITGSAKAWVNFAGNGGAGANQTIRGSYNVAYVYKNATGDYTVQFTNTLGNANYATLVSSNGATAGSQVGMAAIYPYNSSVSSQTATNTRVMGQATGGGGGNVDLPFFMLACFSTGA